MSEAKEIRGDEAGLRALVEEGVPADHIVLRTFEAVESLMGDLMQALPKEEVSREMRLQVMVVAQTLKNAISASRMEMVDLPPEVMAILDTLLESIAVRENARGDGREDDNKREARNGNPENL